MHKEKFDFISLCSNYVTPARGSFLRHVTEVHDVRIWMFITVQQWKFMPNYVENAVSKMFAISDASNFWFMRVLQFPKQRRVIKQPRETISKLSNLDAQCVQLILKRNFQNSSSSSVENVTVKLCHSIWKCKSKVIKGKNTLIELPDR